MASSYSRGVVEKLYLTGVVIAALVVVAGVALTGLGVAERLRERDMYRCTLAFVPAKARDLFFLVSDKGEPFGPIAYPLSEREEWDRWANSSGLSIEWKSYGKDDADPSKVRVPRCRTLLVRRNETSVEVAKSEWDWLGAFTDAPENLPIFGNGQVQAGTGTAVFGLVGLGLLRWLKWLFSSKQLVLPSS
jgi:hypothetical protein